MTSDKLKIRELSSLLDIDKNGNPRKEKFNPNGTKVDVTKFQSVTQSLASHSSVKNMTDEELIEFQPPPTGYNSQEGYVIIGGRKYNHGEKGPDGDFIDAPVLTDEQWAKKYEKFEKVVKVWNKKRNRFDSRRIQIEPTLNEIDYRFMKAIWEHDKVLILSYRGSRKSANAQRYVKRQILDYQMKVAYFSVNADLAGSFSAIIHDTLENNPTVLRDYGYIINKDLGNSKYKMYWFSQSGMSARDPGLGIGSADGKSMLGGHPDILVLDDVVSEDASGHDVTLANTEKWYTKQIDPMATSNTKIIVVGTPKDPKDLYLKTIHETEQFEEIRIPAIEVWPNENQSNPGNDREPNKWFYVRHKKDTETSTKIKGVGGLIGGKVSLDSYNEDHWLDEGRVQYYLEDGKTVDRQRMALQEFLLKRKSGTPESFEAEFQINSVTLTSGYLNLKLIKGFAWETINIPREQLMENCCAFFDQAFGESNLADKNCIAVLAKHGEFYYILDIFVWRSGRLDLKVEMVKRVKSMYPEIMEFGVEAGQINMADCNAIVEQCSNIVTIIPVFPRNYKKTDIEDEEHDLPMNIDFGDLKIQSNKKGKVIRIINQWSTKLTMSQVFIRTGINQEAIDEFESEYSFPLSKRFDVLDAIGSCFDLCDQGGMDSFFFLKGNSLSSTLNRFEM